MTAFHIIGIDFGLRLVSTSAERASIRLRFDNTASVFAHHVPLRYGRQTPPAAAIEDAFEGLTAGAVRHLMAHVRCTSLNCRSKASIRPSSSAVAPSPPKGHCTSLRDQAPPVCQRQPIEAACRAAPAVAQVLGMGTLPASADAKLAVAAQRHLDS